MKTRIVTIKNPNIIIRALYAFFILAGILWVSEIYAQGNPYVVDTILSVDGQLIEVVISPSPPQPPRSIDRTAVALPQIKAKASIITIDGVPAFDWCFGCSPTSAAMIAGYYDRHGFSDMYTGPTNSGMMPLDNSSWPQWHDGSQWLSQCPLSATHNGLDGRVTTGHVDDYWIQYGSSAQDPFIGNWTEHTYGDCTADYMKTSQSTYSNSDGSTRFYYFPSGAPMTAASLVSNSVEDQDGGYGIKLFYESRGYTVTNMFNQYIKGYGSDPDLGFTYAQYCTEIDANRPVMIHIEGHTMVGVGYDDASDTMYIHDTWDYDVHKMEWGSTYTNMQHMGVTIVQLQGTIQYTVTFVEGSNGGITGTLVQNVDPGGNCTEVEAVPDANYHFTGWTGDYTGITNPLTITNVTADMTITANFAIDTHTVTFVEGSNGSITGTMVQDITHGSNCSQVTAVAGANYHFTGWTGDYTGTANPLTITNVTADMTITANFAIDTHTVTFVEGSNGSITGTLVQDITHGSNCSPVTASADANYHFTGWTGDYTGITNPLTITNVTADMTITANFAIDTHTVTFVEGANGSITGTLVQNVTHGSNCSQVTAAADANYHFTGWSGDYTGTTNPLTITNVTSDMTITANFAIDTHTVTFVEGSNGSITGTLVQNVTHGSNCSQVTAVASANYHFTGWSGDYTGTTNPLTITNVTADMTITANFAIDQYTVTFNAAPNGDVNGQFQVVQTVDHGSNAAAVTANPNSGYHFDGWTGDSTTSTNPLTIRDVTSNVTVTANFAINSYTVTVSSGSNGSVNPSGDQSVDHGNTLNVTATPSSGYHFTSWDVTGGVAITDGDETGVFTITGNGTIQASFAINDYTVTVSSNGNGTVTPSGDQPAAHNEVLLITANADVGYHFDSWSTTGGVTINDGDETGEFTITGNGTISANFAVNEYTVTFNASINGDVNGQSQVIQTVDHGSNCTAVTANPSAGYHLNGWTGDYIGTDNPLTITNVTADMTTTANFVINTYSVMVSSSGNGIVTPSGEQNVDHNEILSVTASPNTDYQFSEWNITGSVTIVDGDESGLFRITGEGTIIAVFRLATSVINNGDTPKITSESFSASPNPVPSNEKTYFFFQGKFKSDAELIIYDHVGNLVFKESYPQIGGDENKPKKFGEWNLRNRNGRVISSGTYLAVLTVSGDFGKKERYITKIGVREF